jgi:hypothetical protein
MARVNVDVVPEVGRPPEVAAVLAEAVELRAKLREATERLASLQAQLDEQEQADVEAAAQAIRKGTSPGAISATIGKSRAAVEAQTRQARALTLARDACEADLASTIIAHADEWHEALDLEVEQGREQARRAVAELRSALTRVGEAVATQRWLDGGDFGQRPVGVMTGSFAPSSRRRTANNEPLGIDELLGYAGDLVDPPQPAARPVLRTAASDAA